MFNLFWEFVRNLFETGSKAAGSVQVKRVRAICSGLELNLIKT